MWWRTRRTRIAELDAELRAHLAMATHDCITRGESPDDAERHAREDFGDLVRVREVTVDVWAGNRLANVAQDLRYALRCLKRTPAFTVSAALTLAIGIGAAAAMFAIVHGVLLEPLPYGDANRLVDVRHEAQLSGVRRIPQTPASYLTYKRLARTIDGIGLYRVGTGNIWVGGESAQPEQVPAAWMTASTIPTLRVSPTIGRTFGDDEDRLGGPTVAVISEALWRARFGGAPDVLGKTLYVNDIPRRIIGVMPERFRFPTAATRIWLPARLDLNTRYAGDFNFSAVARLRPHVTPEQAGRDLATVLPRIAESFPTLEAEGMSTVEWLDVIRPQPVVIPLRDAITGGIAQTLWMLAVAAAFVLFVACASVANLILIRSEGRQLELAIREAIGAGRLRVMSQLLVESTLLSVSAGAVGLALAWAAVRALVGFGPTDIPRLAELDIDVAAIGFTGLMCVVAGFIGAVVSTLHVARASSFASLRDSGRTGTAGKARHRLRRTIAGFQIALALVVLAGAGLLLRTFQQLRDVRPGFDAANVTTLWMQLPVVRYRADSAVVRFYAALRDRVLNLPDVAAVGLTSRVPLGAGTSAQSSFSADGGVSSDAHGASLRTYSIDDGYLAAMHIPLVAGQPFQRADFARRPVAIVSRQGAKVLWGDASGRIAIGKRLRLVAGGPWHTVIGVAGDVRDSELSSLPAPTVYFPHTPSTDPILGQRAPRTMALVVRAAHPDAVTAAIRRILHGLDPTLPVFNVQTMSEVLRASTARLSFTLMLMGAAAVITLVLGAIGLYGVTAYVVALRRRELGLRIALGAEPKGVVMLITRQGLSLAASGVAAGALVFAVIARFLKALLYGVAPSDPVALVGAVIMLFLVAAMASWLPARRVAMIDPAESLRAE